METHADQTLMNSRWEDKNGGGGGGLLGGRLPMKEDAAVFVSPLIPPYLDHHPTPPHPTPQPLGVDPSVYLHHPASASPSNPARII